MEPNISSESVKPEPKGDRPFQQLRNHQPFNYRLKESMSESIPEEINL